MSLDIAIKETIAASLKEQLQPIIAETFAKMFSAAKSDEADELLTTKEVARRSGEAEITWVMRRMEGRGPKYLKLGRNVRYRWSDVAAWMQQHANLVGRRGRPANAAKEVQTSGGFHGRGKRAAVNVVEVG